MTGDGMAGGQQLEYAKRNQTNKSGPALLGDNGPSRRVTVCEGREQRCDAHADQDSWYEKGTQRARHSEVHRSGSRVTRHVFAPAGVEPATQDCNPLYNGPPIDIEGVQVQ